MFRSLARHGSLQRSLRSTSLQSHSLRRPIPLLFSRQLSSIPPSSTEKLDPSKSPPLTNNTNSSSSIRKPKVDLRPGPLVKKPTDQNRPASVETSRVRKSDSRVLQGDDLPSSSTSSVRTSDTVTETTKRDFEDAAKHGILERPPPGASRFRKILHQAGQLIKFYWRGLKMINSNRKHVADIGRRIRQGGTPISRWESRFIQTFKEDALKLVPFVVIVVVLEEIIPLIAIYAPFMLPSTCVLPSQRDRIENSKKARQKAYAETHRHLFKHLSNDESGAIPLTAFRDAALSQAMCGLLSLSTFGFNPMRVRRIRRHMEFISSDDELLTREDMGTNLSFSELTEALQERGLVTAGLNEREQAKRLQSWLSSANDTTLGSPVTRRLFLVARNVARGG